MVSSQFCKEDIGPLDKQAQILTSFTDYVLTENASKWRNFPISKRTESSLAGFLQCQTAVSPREKVEPSTELGQHKQGQVASEADTGFYTAQRRQAEAPGDPSML